jgi:hypothetical protein|tara:strand:+ start:1278 stop:1427 length:150 start_codon:yes stop_codon:yes gene_type:complete
LTKNATAPPAAVKVAANKTQAAAPSNASKVAIAKNVTKAAAPSNVTNVA